MSTESINVAELASGVANILGWYVLGDANESRASIVRGDHMVLRINERRDKKPRVNVYLDVSDIRGVTQYVTNQASTNHSVHCSPTVQAIVSAIMTRLLPGAETTYYEIVADCERQEFERREKVRIMEELAQRLGTRVSGSGGYEQRTRELIQQGEGEVNYRLNGLSLDFKASGDGRSFHLHGYVNYIPVDLMWRLIPVIEQWQAEKLA